MTTRPETLKESLKEQLEHLSSAAVNLCFQCQRCTNGCPLAREMDLLPHEIVHLVRMEQFDELWASRSPWLCAGCQTCTTRCPQGVDLAALNDALKSHLQRHPELAAKRLRVAAFLTAAVDNIRRFGRMYELGLIGMLKLKTGAFTQDMDLGRKMFCKGKLKLLPSGGKSRKKVAAMFARAKKQQERKP